MLYNLDKLKVDFHTFATGADACINNIIDAARDTANRIVVFTHGYNNSFSNSIARGAALAQDIDFGGLLVVWSWPSEGARFGNGWLGSYRFDETGSNPWSIPHFSDFFARLMSRNPDLGVDFLAHSMGSRIVLQYLFDQHLAAHSTVFAAPDVERGEFSRKLLGAATPLETMYASGYDFALWTSWIYHHHDTRAGTGGNSILVLPQMDSIDVNLVGHSYLFELPLVLQDFKKILVNGTPAALRGLKPIPRGTDTYYILNP
jgi:esterase/lipase superfamily enzyme